MSFPCGKHHAPHAGGIVTVQGTTPQAPPGCFSVSLAKSSVFSRRRKTPRDAARLVQLTPKGSQRGAQTRYMRLPAHAIVLRCKRDIAPSAQRYSIRQRRIERKEAVDFRQRLLLILLFQIRDGKVNDEAVALCPRALALPFQIGVVDCVCHGRGGRMAVGRKHF